MIITTDTTVNAPQSILQMSISWYSGWEIGIEIHSEVTKRMVCEMHLKDLTPKKVVGARPTFPQRSLTE